MVQVACLCPPRADGTPRHPDGDEITLRERLDFRGAATVRNSIALLKSADPDASFAEVLAVLTEQYILAGVTLWTVLDADGKPLPVTKPNLRSLLLANDVAATLVGDVADGLYSEQILGPLVQAASRSLPPTPTDESTSPATDSPSESPTPSSPSSTTITPTADIARIGSPRAGDSNSLPSSASAA